MCAFTQQKFCAGWFCDSGLTHKNTPITHTHGTTHTLKSVEEASVSNGLPGNNGHVNHISLGAGSRSREKREKRDKEDKNKASKEELKAIQEDENIMYIKAIA